MITSPSLLLLLEERQILIRPLIVVVVFDSHGVISLGLTVQTPVTKPLPPGYVAVIKAGYFQVILI
jgi:hypothetical protein